MYSIKDYFNDVAERFDGYYTPKKSISLNTIAHNLLRRPGLENRFNHVAKIIGDCKGRRILDVGCGSGIYSIFFAKAGANVIGIDFSAKMIEIANKKLTATPKINCQFICEDFLLYRTDDFFDCSLAIGVFDYLKMGEVSLYLERLKKISSKIIATFPKRYTFQTPIRKIYLLHKGIDTYFYTVREIKDLCRGQALNCKFHNSGPIWTVEMYNSNG